jgi:hypothetical protein
VRLRRNLGSARAWVEVNDDEPGVGPLPTPPPSIFLCCGWRRGGGQAGDHVFENGPRAQRVVIADVTSDSVMRDLPRRDKRGAYISWICNRIRNMIRVTSCNRRRVESSI